MTTWRVRMLAMACVVFVGISLSYQMAEATRDKDDTRPCPSADELAYLHEAAPLSRLFADGMSQFSADPYDRTIIRTELRSLDRVYDDFADLDPPATLEASHEITLLGYAVMIDALNDAAGGDFITATIRLDIGADLATRATELIDNHC